MKLSWRYAGNKSILRNRFGFINLYLIAYIFIVVSILFVCGSAVAAPSISSVVMIAPLESGKKVSYGGDGIDINLTIDLSGASSSYLRYQLWEQINSGPWVQINAGGGYRKISFYRERDLGVWFYERQKPVAPGFYRYRVHIVDDSNGANAWSSGVESDVVEVRAPRKAPKDAPSFFSFTPSVTTASIEELTDRTVFKDSTGTTFMRFAWATVSNDVPLSDLYYELLYKKVGTTEWKIEKINRSPYTFGFATAGSGEVPGMHDMEMYEFSIRACNPIGCGPNRSLLKPVLFDYPEIGTSILNAKLNFKVFDLAGDTATVQNYCFADPVTKKCKADFVRIYGSVSGLSGGSTIYLHKGQSLLKQVSGFSSDLNLAIDLPALDVGSYVFNLTGAGKASGTHLRKRFFVYVPGEGEITTSGCTINPLNNLCDAEIKWKVSGDFPACLYRVNGATKTELSCVPAGGSEQSISVPLNVNQTSFEVQINEPAGIRTVDSLNAQAKFQDVSLEVTPERCDIIRPATFCIARVSWVVSSDYAPCLFKGSEKITCANDGHIDVPVANQNVIFSLVDGASIADKVIATDNVRALKAPTGSLTVASGSNNPCVPSNGTTCEVDVVMEHFGGDMGVTLYKGEIPWGNLGTSGETIPVKFTKKLLAEASGTRYSLRANYGGGLYEFASITLFPTTFSHQGYSLTSIQPECTFNPLIETTCKSEVTWSMPVADACIFVSGATTGFCPDSTMLTGTSGVPKPLGVHLYQLRRGNSPNAELVAQVAVTSKEETVASIKVNTTSCGIDWCDLNLGVFTNYSGNVCLYDNGIKVESLCGLSRDLFFANYRVSRVTHHFQLVLETINQDGSTSKLTVAEKSLDDIAVVPDYKDLVVSECNYSRFVCSITVSWYSNLLDTCIYAKKTNQAIFCENGQGTHTTVFDVTELTGNQFELRNVASGSSDLLAEFSVKNVFGGSSRSHTNLSSSSRSSFSSHDSNSSSSVIVTEQSPYLVDGNVNSPPPIELPGSPVGTIAGQFRVSESGAASYSVPLNLPAGVAGVTPQLSFDYASQSGNGLLGQGWSLSGLSAITRCRQTLIHDGETKPITWSKDDRFCLDGQRLMLVSGSYYGQPSSEYRTEIDNYSLVTAVGGSDGHPDYFKVEAKDGSVSYYGYTSDSKLTGGVQNTTLNWALNRFQDNVGNGIDFVYNNNFTSGQNVHEIRYGFPTPNGVTPSATRTDFKSRIQFSYDERDDKSDAFVAGYKFSQTRKLASVDIYSTDNSSGFESSKLFRHYQLKYMSNTTTDARYENTLTRLSHIYECVTPDIVGGSCLLPLSFSWGGGSHIAFDKNMTEVSFPAAEPGRYVLNNLFADVTGDGKVDLIYLTYEKGIDETHADISINIAYAKNDATGLGIQERINLYNKPYENIRIATLDYNADGRQDLAVYDEGHWKVHLAVINTDKQWRISKVDVVNLGSLTDKDTLFMDVNGDGLADAVTAQGYYLLKRNANAVHSNAAYSFSLQLTELTWGNTGFAEINAPSPTSINALTNCTQVAEGKKLQQETAADFNGDGAVDFLGTYNRTLICGVSGVAQPAHVTLAYRYALVNYNGQLFNYGGAALQTPTVLGGNTDKLFTIDINSDGLSDIVQLRTDKKLSVRMNTGAGFNAAQEWTTLSGLPAGSSPQFLDYNGDGAADVIWRDTTKGKMLVHYWGTAATATVALFNTSISEKDSYLMMDVSGDSVVDYLRISSESMSGRVGQMALKAEPICETYPTGRGNEIRTQCNDPSYPIAENQQHNAIYKVENGLGNITQISYGSLSNSGHYQTADVNPELISNVVSINCPPNIPAYCNPTYTSYSVDSSGFYGRLNGRWELPADHNVYDPTTKAIVAAGTTTSKVNPVLEVNGSMQVVTIVKSSAPLPNAPQAMSEVNYFYGEAKIQAMGRGFLGFGRLKTVDKQTGITTVTTYRQDFPFAGSPLSTTVYKNNSPGASILSYAINNWDAQIFGGDGARRFQPYLKQSSEYSYVMDSAGVVSTDALQTVTTTMVMYPNEHGNVQEVTSVTQGSGKTITQKTTNEYYSSDIWALRMGRLKRSSVNTTNPQGDSVTRIAEFKYYGVGGEGISGGAKGLLKEEKVIASKTSDQLVTEYTYDQWGNKQTVSITGEVGNGVIQTRSTTSTYDPSGRNLVSTKNDSNQESLFGQYNVYGQPQVATDKNKLSAEIKYDAFGNEYLRVEKLSAEETGAWTRKDSGYCATSNCPGGAAFYTRSRVSGGGEAVEYFDILGRVIRAGKISFDGRWVYTDTEYDSLNRVKRQSLPYFSGFTAQDWVENHYDDLGRITQVDSPHEHGTINSKTEYTASFNGLITTLINPKGQKRKEVRNGLGQLISVEDELGGSVSYEYSVLGGLLSVTTKATDAADVVIKMCYDDLGRKTGMFDPDKGGFSGKDETCETVNNWTGNTSGAVDGWWHYRYNAFGELLEQRDPKGQRTLMQYDELGRMINRKDYESGSLLEAHTAWFYDTPFGESEPTDKTLGKLTAVVMSNNTSVIENNNRTCDKIYGNHCVIYRYNDRAMVDMTWTLLSDGQDYFTETQYDDIGRAYEQRDVINGPIFLDSGVQTHFNEYGYAYRTVDIAPWDGTDGVLSTIKEMNVNGQVTKELRGNGLETVNTYYPKSGLLQSQVARDALGTRALQSNYYTWDELGNLTSRVNRGAHVFKEGQPLQQNNRKESFCYDALNRLVKTLPTDNPICSGTASPTDDIAYDGLGNIKRKNGVGSYSYSRINGGPHAVTKAGNASYSYDNNGNMVAESNSGYGLGDRSFFYTSYDMLKKITRGSSSAVEFKYGPDRARWQRIDSNLTTTTYLGNVERIETANTHEVEWKRTVAGVVHTYKTTVDADKQNLQVLNVSKAYLYKDHLGSVDIITNQLGTPTHSMSFDPWGARRKGDSNDVLAWVKGAGETDQLVVQNMLGSLSLTGFSNPITTRGYTGHEMVDGMDIIHMNGRIYDPKLARFLQADPFIQAATNTQSFNRYSYVLNNPLNATDPSGFFFNKIEKEFKRFHRNNIRDLVKVFGADVVNFAGNIAAMFCGPWAAACSAGWNYDFSRAMGATSSQAFRSAAVAGVTVAFGQALNTSGLTFGERVVVSAMFGGVMAELQGGKFGHGFASAGLNTMFGGVGTEKFNVSGMITNALVSGTISELTGGKFKNGAQSAAMNYALQWAVSTIGTGGTTPENKPSSNGSCNSKNPINIATGEKYLTMTDYKAEGASQMTFERYYSSYAGEKTSLGIGWRSNFDRRLQLDSVGEVTLRVVAIRHQGDPIMFNWVGDEYANGGRWETDDNRYESIRKIDSGWELQLTNNSHEIYNDEGRLIAIKQIDGYEQTLVYGDQGTVKNVLLSVKDNFGQQLQFAYDLQARMTSMTATDGSVTRYEYDAVDNLAKVISPDETPADDWDNAYVVYDYNDKRFSHAITGIRNSQGQRIHSMAYDESGRAVLSALGDDVERVDMVFSAGENHTKKTVVINSLGKNTEYTFDQHNKPLVVEGQPTATCIGANQGYEYNDKGQLTSKTDWNGSTTQYEYNDRGLETLRVEAVGTAEERRVETQWHAQWRLPVQVTSAGLVVEFDYNDAGQLMQRIERDTLAEQTALQKLLQQYPERVWGYSYNAQGLLQFVDGPRTDVQDVTEFEYDAKGNRTAVINALGHRSEVLAVNERGLPEQVRDANGVVTVLAYNARGWLTHKTLKSDQGDSTTVYHYSGVSDYNNQGLISSVTLPNGEEITYEYDSARRLTAQYNKAGERLEYTLDLEGNRTEQRIYNATGALTFSQAQMFDELSRLLASIGADGNAIGFGYDKAGNRTTTTDALGHNTSYAYDALNRLIATTDALDGEVIQTYDAANRVTSITDQRGLTTQYRYNGFGNKIAQISPDTGETQYSYDEAGNLARKTDARGVVTQYRYDVLSRVTDVIYPAANDDNIHYRYDEQHNANSIGRISRISDASGEQVYSYNDFGQVTGVQSQIGVTRYNQSYDYDRNGQLVAQQYPSGRRVNYHYDAQGRLATVDTEYQDRSENVLTHIRHQPFGSLATLGYGNGTQLQIGQDKNYRIRSQQLSGEANDALYHRGYDYDANSNIVGITDYNKPAANQVFVYDALSRLTDATGNYGTVSYGYDAVGNRISRTQNNRLEDYTYAENSNRLLSVISEGERGDLATRTLGYDAVGNITNDSANLNAKILGFGANNRLEQVTISNGSTNTVAAYQYNAKGQRVSKQVDGKIIHFHYDTENRLLAETTESGTPIREYIYAANQRIALVDYQQNSQGVVYFIVNDHLGTPQLLLDAQQQVVWSVDQSPFGEVKVEGSVEQPLRFPGQYADIETGYSYNYFRDYDPTLGRYIESDPIGLEAGVNTFGYVMGNPIGAFDIFGLDSYFVSRPLDAIRNYANHNFIVSHARYLGDPLAQVYSWGNTGSGYMGRVYNGTPGISSTTAAADARAWLLAPWDRSVSYRVLNSTDDNVRNLALSVNEGQPYSLIPELTTLGVNSNTAAGVVAYAADAGGASLTNGKLEPGSSALARGRLGLNSSCPVGLPNSFLSD